MSAITHNLKQGTQDWLDYRKDHFNASDASAMLGLSPYKSRDALLEEKATGITSEVNEVTQRIFNEGHRLEKQARPSAEVIIGEDLFQPTMSLVMEGLNLSASFDGLTMMDDAAWEHKTLNKKLKVNLEKGIIPEGYKPQLEQQMIVSGADKVLFMASDDNESFHVWYKSDELLRKRLIAGWKQFDIDLKNWKPREVVVELVAEKVEQLPSLNVQIEGGVTSSNLAAYESNALKFIKGINTDLQTDSDFANADAVVKFCSRTEKELDQVKQAALDQTADIADLFKTIDNLKSEMRSKRLDLDKLVKARKNAIRSEIINESQVEFNKFMMGLNTSMPQGLSIVFLTTDFNNAVKNKRTIKSLHNAVNTELARCKSEVNELADQMRGNFNALQDIAGDYGFLFRDIQDIVTKDKEDLINLAKQRIAEHEEVEAKRLEVDREKIRLEEEAKAAAKVHMEEAARIKKEEEDIAKAEREAAEKVAELNSYQEEESLETKVLTDVDDTNVVDISKPNQESKKNCNDAEINSCKKPDCDYFRTQIGIVLTHMDNYTKDELRTAFRRLADEV